MLPHTAHQYRQHVPYINAAITQPRTEVQKQERKKLSVYFVLSMDKLSNFVHRYTHTHTHTYIRTHTCMHVGTNYLLNTHCCAAGLHRYWEVDQNDFGSRKCGWSHGWDSFYSITCRTAWSCGIVWLIYVSLFFMRTHPYRRI